MYLFIVCRIKETDNITDNYYAEVCIRIKHDLFNEWFKLMLHEST